MTLIEKIATYIERSEVMYKGGNYRREYKKVRKVGKLTKTLRWYINNQGWTPIEPESNLYKTLEEFHKEYIDI